MNSASNPNATPCIQQHIFIPTWLSILAILVSSWALYIPFTNNSLVFDDLTFLQNGSFLRYATNPFDLTPRTFPYFTFAFIHTLTQSFEIQRVFNTTLHGLTGVFAFFTLREFFSIQKPDNDKNTLPTLLALFFVLHPTAVYGVAYLTQRTILFSGFFSFLALWSYSKGLIADNWHPIIYSSLLCSMAIMSKEHAILLPIAIVICTFFLQQKSNKINYIKPSIFILATLPAVGLAIYSKVVLVGSIYEPQVQLYESNQQLPEFPWLSSITLQCKLFLNYLRLWLVPDVNFMSIDMRFNHPDTTSGILGAVGYICYIITGALLLSRTNKFRLAGTGLIYIFILHIVELSTVKFQEPFVIYRSYLWTPGFLLILLNIYLFIPRHIALASSAIIIPFLTIQSIDRLTSFQNSKTVWEDAARKLPSEETPGSFRIFYNLSVSEFRSRNYEKAISNADKAIKSNPYFPGGYHVRSLANLRSYRYENALSDIEQALLLTPTPERVAFLETKGRILAALGNKEEAERIFSEVDNINPLVGLLRRGIWQQPENIAGKPHE